MTPRSAPQQSDVSARNVSARYYKDKLDSLRSVFGAQRVELDERHVVVDGSAYPVIDDVIICLPPEKWPASVANALRVDDGRVPGAAPGTVSPARESFAEDVQFTFGEEGKTFDKVLPEHRAEFDAYFRTVDIAGLRDKRVCDLGCGIGRWSFFLAGSCRELMLTDFSEAIFSARRNLAGTPTAIFVMADIAELPFADDAFDFLFCLGVLHHLPADALQTVRKLRRLAGELLIYLYYALDNRPAYFRLLLSAVTHLRVQLARVRSTAARDAVSWALTLGVYAPMVGVGHVAQLAGQGHRVPLYEFYHGKSLGRLRQDVYDRFFTRIEQRVSRAQIRTLEDSFREIIISPELPYWTFLCRR